MARIEELQHLGAGVGVGRVLHEIEAAARAGVDSIEHGSFVEDETLHPDAPPPPDSEAAQIVELDREIAEIDALDRQRAQLLARKAVIEELQGNRSQMVHLFDSLVRTIPVERMREANYMVDRDTDKRSADEAAGWLARAIGR